MGTGSACDRETGDADDCGVGGECDECEGRRSDWKGRAPMWLTVGMASGLDGGACDEQGGEELAPLPLLLPPPPPLVDRDDIEWTRGERETNRPDQSDSVGSSSLLLAECAAAAPITDPVV